jgi:hypothetical protein
VIRQEHGQGGVSRSPARHRPRPPSKPLPGDALADGGRNGRRPRPTPAWAFSLRERPDRLIAIASGPGPTMARSCSSRSCWPARVSPRYRTRAPGCRSRTAVRPDRGSRRCGIDDPGTGRCWGGDAWVARSYPSEGTPVTRQRSRRERSRPRGRPGAPGDRRRSRGAARCWTPVATCRPPARPRDTGTHLSLSRSAPPRYGTELLYVNHHTTSPNPSPAPESTGGQIRYGVRSGESGCVAGCRVTGSPLAVQQGERLSLGQEPVGLTAPATGAAVLVASGRTRVGWVVRPGIGSARERRPSPPGLSGLGVRETAW